MSCYRNGGTVMLLRVRSGADRKGVIGTELRQ
jgi:hypothetical protein